MSTVQKWLSKAAVKTRYSVSDRQLADLVAAGFPEPHYFGPRSPRWSVDLLAQFDERMLRGEVVIASRPCASSQTAAARAAYMAKVASGEVRASRQATAARRRQEAA